MVRDGNVRNLQVTGCDLEANMPGKVKPTETANILLDVSGSADDRRKSIAGDRMKLTEQSLTMPGGVCWWRD